MYETDWNNIDLDSPCERDLSILDAYTFDQLLLEISCNLPAINETAVRQQFETELKSRIESAREVFEANLENIVDKAIEERESDDLEDSEEFPDEDYIEEFCES